MSTPPATDRSARTRRALRDVAIRHFVEVGFDAASVPAIAAEVGVTERTFYRHFATKDEVLFADLGHGLPWFRDALVARLDAGDALPDAVGRALLAPPIEPRLLLDISRLRRQLLRPERIERSYREAQGAMAGHIREVLRDRGEAPLRTAVVAETLAGAVFAALGTWNELPEDGKETESLVALCREAIDAVRCVVTDHHSG